MFVCWCLQVFEEQHKAQKDRWSIPPVLEKVKARAKCVSFGSLGLWVFVFVALWLCGFVFVALSLWLCLCGFVAVALGI